MNSVRMSWFALFGILAVAAATAALTGCGDGGPPRYRVSGSATYAGQPIPAGSIVFQPDGAKGNKGPAGFATIKDGKYDTREGGKGVIGGPHQVRIAGFDGVKKEDMPDGAPLFPEFNTDLDLPKDKDFQKDFDVPKGGTAPAARAKTNFSDV